ncbi:hypothetical protein D7X94_02380 [Acutalibacter sp. 1XD8-33]|uniref:hypothetical protein n=1 Tax=Acutalibacter sp. 1XD8-33 TaxID=2320081 RepID=UPI000EA37CD5|nr:hypothetical protein [Acutalibacter sp. 1XD8-33]RKJ41681.1 hypothetical protein D7X94_02380 [Acutalibacter sp. 1XD8-33]
MKKLALLMALVMLLAEFPSCSFTGLSAQNLMSPPKTNADQQSIYRLLQGSQNDVTFIYPKNGEYRSAIIMRDFTGDGTEDAIGFHEVEDGGVEVQFLTKSQGEWQTAAAFLNKATQVDRVCFGSLADNREAVFIGWGSTAGATGRTAEVKAYLYDGEEGVSEYSLGVYGELALTDFDSDGVNELFTVDKSVVPAEEEGAEPTTAYARLYTFDRGQPYEAAAAQADNDISTYTSTTFGQLNASMQGVVVDGTTADGSMTTQIFVYQDGQLVNYPQLVNTEDYVNEYARPSAASFTSRDINGDGYIELPVVSLLPNLFEDTAPDSTGYMVEWKALNPSGENRVVLRALMNSRENYWFRLPYVLQGRICAANDLERRTVTYTEVITGEDGISLLGGTLFSIRVFTQSSWESRGETSGYTMLAAQNDSVYGIQIRSKDEKYRQILEEISRSFQLLAD